MRRVAFPCLFAVLLVAFAPLRATPLPPPLTGEIDGAHYTINTPSTDHPWSGGVLFIAHGYRPESAPLVADLNPEQAAYATLLDEGWIVAKTSYRRNGIIVEDAITDLLNLDAFIRQRFGAPTLTVVEGDSMGGTIVTHLAELDDSPFDGFIAIGAALDLTETNGAAGVSLRPRHPLLFVANRSEIAGPRGYLETVLAQQHTPDLVAPALFRIDRDGHVNVNQAERLYAIRHLVRWLEAGRSTLPVNTPNAPHDATQPAAPQPSQVVFDDDHRGFTATVTDVSAIYGNVWLNAQPADFAAIGLDHGLWAQLTAGGATYRVRHGRDFSDVERGQWVTFPNADGFYWLSRNFANAAGTAHLKVGDTVHLRRFDATGN